MDKQSPLYGKRKRIGNYYVGTGARGGISTPVTSKTVGTQKSDAIAAKALYEVNKLKKNMEVFFHRTTITSSLDVGAPLTVCLTLIAQGDTESSRHGTKIKLYSFQFSGQLTSNDALDERAMVRIFIFIDWRNQGAFPTIADLFNSGTELEDNKPRLSQSNLMSRFTVIYDQVIHCQAQTLNVAGTGFAAYYQPIHKFYKKISHQVFFNGALGDIASQRKGSIYAMLATNVDDSLVEIETVLKFKDP